MVKRYHRQVKGKNQGKWVPCHARLQCRIQREMDHVPAEVYNDIQVWLKDQGINKPPATITDADINRYYFSFGYMDTPRYQPGSLTPLIVSSLPDSSLPANNRVRSGLNNPDAPSELLTQLDSEGAILRLSLSDDAIFSLNQYSAHAHQYINLYNREGSAGAEKYVREHYNPVVVAHNQASFDKYEQLAVEHVKELDNIFANHERKETNKRVLYRASTVKGDVKEWVNKNFSVGGSYTDKSYMSTSLDSDYMLVHGSSDAKQTVVFEILTSKGIPIHDPKHSIGNVSYAEREVLLNRNSKFKVVNITEATYKTTWEDGGPKGHSAYSDAKPKARFTVIQLIEE